MALGLEDENALLRQAAVARLQPALLDIVGQRRACHVKAQLDGTGDLVDVLPPRALRPDGAQLYFTVVDVQRVFHGTRTPSGAC